MSGAVLVVAALFVAAAAFVVAGVGMLAGGAWALIVVGLLLFGAGFALRTGLKPNG